MTHIELTDWIAKRGMGRWSSQALSFGITQWGMLGTAGCSVSHLAMRVRSGTPMEGPVHFLQPVSAEAAQ